MKPIRQLPTERTGVTLYGQTTTFLPAGTKFRCLRDQIIVRVTNWQPSKIVEVVREGRPLCGVVVAAGPGCYPIRYNRDRSRCWPSRAFRRTEVRPGDEVELGGLELQGYGFLQIMVGGELHVVCREEDVCGIRDLPRSA